MSLFTTLNEASICEKIINAKKLVILAAPGIGMTVAKALVKAHHKLGNDFVQVVLDVSAKAARIGYGDHEATKLLFDASITIKMHDGLRIGALICDDEGWSFASAPLAVELSPKTNSKAFNAITLNSSQVALLKEELPLTNNKSTPLIKDQALGATREVGTKDLDKTTLNNISKALKLVPPKEFDIDRQTQVYVAILQFVELKVVGLNIQNRKVQLPRSLPILSIDNHKLNEKLSTSYKFFEENNNPQSLTEVMEHIEALRKKFLLPVGRFGRVILKSNLTEFKTEYKKIELELNDVKNEITKNLQEKLDKNCKELIDSIVDNLNVGPIQRLTIVLKLKEHFPTAEKLISGMKIDLLYKDVTYQTLNDEEFIEMVQKVVPKDLIADALLVEEIALTASKN